jgi:hypothetical protein
MEYMCLISALNKSKGNLKHLLLIVSVEARVTFIVRGLVAASRIAALEFAGLHEKILNWTP